MFVAPTSTLGITPNHVKRERERYRVAMCNLRTPDRQTDMYVCMYHQLDEIFTLGSRERERQENVLLLGAAAYQLENTSSRTITEVKQR